MYKRQKKISLNIVLHILAGLGNPTMQQRKRCAPARAIYVRMLVNESNQTEWHLNLI